MKKILLILIMWLAMNKVFAGFDAAGYVQRVWVHPSGTLYFKIDAPGINDYCNANSVWYGFDMYIPSDDKNFHWYYSTIMSALVNNKRLYIANLDPAKNTDGACNIASTGYGIVIRHDNW